MGLGVNCPDDIVASRADATFGVGSGPSKRLGWGGICANVLAELTCQVGGRGKHAERDHGAFDLGKQISTWLNHEE